MYIFLVHTKAILHTGYLWSKNTDFIFLGNIQSSKNKWVNVSAQETSRWQKQRWTIHSSLVTHISRELGFWQNREEMVYREVNGLGETKTSNWGTAEEALLLGNNQASIITRSWKKTFKQDRTWISECIIKGLERMVRTAKLNVDWNRQLVVLKNFCRKVSRSVQTTLQNGYMKEYRAYLLTFTPAA